VEAVECFCFRFQRCIKLVATEFASATLFKVLPLPQKFNCFQLPHAHPCPCFMINVSASGSSKRQMLPSSLPLPAYFFKVLPLSHKFNRFHCFGPHISALNK